MPTYEYQCPEGHLFEKFQKMTDRPRAKCPVCGKPASRKISGGAGLVFKGSGFYITDYGKDGKGPRKPESEKAAAEGKSDTAAKPDAKAAPKAESKPESKSGAGSAKSAPSKREGRASSE
jgi:putative FmdB family regulatory protein